MTDLMHVLDNRGILQQAQLAGWQAHGNGWLYPIYDVEGNVLCWREKNADSNATPKYRWPKGKARGADYYILSGLADAIREHNGQVIIASGEPDLLTFKSAGLHNVLNWFGETSVPSNLPAFLASLGVTRAVNYPDRDKTGGKATKKIAAALHGSGIQFDALQLPEYLGDKGDINTLWQRVEFDRAAFLAALKNDTRAISITIPARTPRKVGQGGKLPSEPLEAIPAALGLGNNPSDYKKTNGWSKKACACPFCNHEHDDKQPAAYWHRDMHILKCFKCGEKYLAKEVSAALGIEWKTPQKSGRPANGKIDKNIINLSRGTNQADISNRSEARYHFAQGIPDTLREELLNLHLETSIKDQAPALMVLELRQHAIAAGHLAPTAPLTVNWLLDYAGRINWHTSAGVMRRGLKQLEALGFVDIRQTSPNGDKGRPIDHYHPQPLDEALRRLSEVIRYRIRERAFRSDTPDEVTPAWHDNQPADMAAHLANLENARRQRLYEENAAARQKAEKQCERAIRRMQGRLRLTSLVEAHSTVLVDDLECRKASDYRALYLRSKVKHDGERTIARAKVAAQLGVSSKYVSQMRVKAGIVAEEQFEVMEITDAANVAAAVDDTFPWAKNYEFGKYLDNGQGERRSLAYNKQEELDRWAAAEMGKGHTVTAYIQTASRERLAKEGEIMNKPSECEDVRERRQSKPPRPSDKDRDFVEELLAGITEDTAPNGLTIAYRMRQIALTPGITRGELRRYFDLFSNCHPLREEAQIQGGDNMKKNTPDPTTLYQKEGENPPEDDFETFAIEELGAEIEMIA